MPSRASPRWISRGSRPNVLFPASCSNSVCTKFQAKLCTIMVSPGKCRTHICFLNTSHKGMLQRLMHLVAFTWCSWTHCTYWYECWHYLDRHTRRVITPGFLCCLHRLWCKILDEMIRLVRWLLCGRAWPPGSIGCADFYGVVIISYAFRINKGSAQLWSATHNLPRTFGPILLLSKLCSQRNKESVVVLKVSKKLITYPLRCGIKIGLLEDPIILRDRDITIVFAPCSCIAIVGFFWVLLHCKCWCKPNWMCKPLLVAHSPLLPGSGIFVFTFFLSTYRPE